MGGHLIQIIKTNIPKNKHVNKRYCLSEKNANHFHSVPAKEAQPEPTEEEISGKPKLRDFNV